MEYEFSAEKIAESEFWARMCAGECSPDELAEYLNAELDQSARKNIAAMFDDHIIPIEYGEMRIRETNSFDSWKRSTGWEPTD